MLVLNELTINVKCECLKGANKIDYCRSVGCVDFKGFSLPHSRKKTSILIKIDQKKIKVNIDSAYQPWFRVHLCLGTVATSKLTSRILCSITRWASMAFIYAPWSCRRSYVPSNGVPWIMSHVVPPTPRIIATIFRYNDKNSTDSLKSN